MKTTKRRRREGKTNYLKRLKLLKSKKPRVVVRKTNKYIISQYTTSTHAQDKVELSISSKKLLEYGWPEEAKGSLKSISASYLSGFLMGKKIKAKGLKEPIIDLGLNRSVHGSRLYAFVNGIQDAGLKINSSKDIFPSNERINSSKKKVDINKIKSKIEEKNVK